METLLSTVIKNLDDNKIESEMNAKAQLGKQIAKDVGIDNEKILSIVINELDKEIDEKKRTPDSLKFSSIIAVDALLVALLALGTTLCANAPSADIMLVREILILIIVGITGILLLVLGIQQILRAPQNPKIRKYEYARNCLVYYSIFNKEWN